MRYFQLLFLILIASNSIFGQVTLKTFLGASFSNPTIHFRGLVEDDRRQILENFYEGINSLYIGVQFSRKMNNRFSINIDLQSSLRGIRAADIDNYYYKANYLDVIPSLDFNLGKFIKFGAGPFYSLKIYEVIETPPLPNLKVIRSRDYGFMISATTTFKRLTFRLMYLRGFNATFLATESEFKHSVLQFGLGYTIRRTKEKDSR